MMLEFKNVVGCPPLSVAEAFFRADTSVADLIESTLTSRVPKDLSFGKLYFSKKIKNAAFIFYSKQT